MYRYSGILGIVIFLLIAYLMSNNKKKIPYKTVAYGLIIQFLFAIFMLKTSAGVIIFNAVNKFFVKVLSYSDQGAAFLFGKLVSSQDIGASLAFQVLPLIIFVSAIMGVLVYLGVIQFIVKIFARLFYKTLKITGAEAFIASLQIFTGIEGITGVTEYIRNMNESRIFVVMTTFMATIASSVMAAYVNFGASAGHLLTASIMNTPAAIILSKIVIPDTEIGESDSLAAIKMEKTEKNMIEAAANGASQGLNLALQIGAMLIAFISIIYLLNDVVGISGMTMENLLGYILSPVATLIGVPIGMESIEVGQLFGIKTIFSEFLSYMQLKTHIVEQTLSPRTIAIATYAMCGFIHFGSIAILIGGIGTLVPSQKPVVSKLALKALATAFMATAMTGAIAGLLL